MAGNWTFSDFKKVFRRYGVKFRFTGKGHVQMKRQQHGETRLYVIPLVSGREVKALYIPKARKALGLTAKDGVADRDFRP